MKGYTIQHSINLLEKAVENGGSGGSTAADISYDNTSSHLTADDVQEAIDELNTAIGQISGDVTISSTESKIGTYDGEDLYAKTFEISFTTSGYLVQNQIYIGDVNNLAPADASRVLRVVVTEGLKYMGGNTDKVGDDWVTTIVCIYAQTATPIKGTIFYTKTAPTRKTTKKK